MGMDGNAAPLQGVKVIELGSLIAGPYAASLFAQFGADVIKIETPGEGDPLRRWRRLHNGTSLWWYSQSRNKKSVTLNLKSEKGRDIVRRLVRGADVLVEVTALDAVHQAAEAWLQGNGGDAAAADRDQLGQRPVERCHGVGVAALEMEDDAAQMHFNGFQTPD